MKFKNLKPGDRFICDWKDNEEGATVLVRIDKIWGTFFVHRTDVPNAVNLNGGTPCTVGEDVDVIKLHR